MSRTLYLTKSAYRKALQCPTKLYYQAQPETYENLSLDDPFLKALASGGFQVGELAKIYFPGGHAIDALDAEQALAETAAYLTQENVVLYEAAFRFENFFVRVDVLVKTKDRVCLYEVKAKSIDPGNYEFFNKTLLKKGVYSLTSEWKDYLYDVAFQTMVCQRSYPSLAFHPFLMLADKSAETDVSGLNQRFLLKKGDAGPRVAVAPGTDGSSVGRKILCAIDVADVVACIHEGRDVGVASRSQMGRPGFYEEATLWAHAYREKDKLEPSVGKDCRSCEFRCHASSLKKSGFEECWEPKLREKPREGEMVIHLWNFRKAAQLIAEGRYWLKDMVPEDLTIRDDGGEGMDAGRRQWLQVEKLKKSDPTPAVERSYLGRVMAAWKFPYHCIDFETTMVAIPFNEGRRPYEQMAFQFSHHIIDADGRVSHAGQYFHGERGEFPNFHFLRALKKELELDEGTIFRYSNHENTVLCQIYEQLKGSRERDKDELMAFIRSISKSSASSSEKWEGPRSMFDLWELVKKAYYHPATLGSNSIKKVLPAVLKESIHLRQKYGKPIYGAAGGIPSLNFQAQTWLAFDEAGRPIDPYRQLGPIFEGIDQERLEEMLSEGDELADGGAAMMAYARMQFSEMSELERDALRKALLRYCELDTLAMVMIIEHFIELAGRASSLRARSS